MRLTKAIVALGLLLAVSGTVGAFSFRVPGYEGPVVFDVLDFDMSVVYADDQGTNDGLAAVNALDQAIYAGGGAAMQEYYTAGGTQVFSANGTDFFSDAALTMPIAKPADLEDFWGIFKVRSISTPGGTTLWVEGDDGEEMTGIFYGGTDVFAEFTGDDGEIQEVQSEGIRFDLYLQDAGTFVAPDDATQGSAGRTGFGTYNGINTDASSSLFLTGTSQAVSNDWEFQTIVNLADLAADQVGVEVGVFHSAISLDGGSHLGLFDGDGFVGPFGVADMTIDGHSQNTGVANWTIETFDPIRAEVIPEPLTMLGVGLALSGLGGYIRRRSRS